MSRVNKVHLIGNVGQDPELHGNGDSARAVFSLATARYKEGTDWHRITAFGRLAGIVDQYVRKGSKIYVEGRIEYYETEKEGVKIKHTNIVAGDIQLLDPKGAGEPAPAPTPKPTAKSLSQPNDDLPF
jgi:single-strand DNA-binding protein